MKKIFLIFVVNILLGQGLFESALQSTTNNYELSGYIRSAIFIDAQNDSLFTKGLFSQAKLKITAKKEHVGFALADIRISNAIQNDQQETNISLREAYIDLSVGNFNTRLGKQILPWGRVDVYRSTDNITPLDLRRTFIDPDEMRLGNFLVHSSFQIDPEIHLKGIWIPRYAPNEFPVSVFQLPQGVEYNELSIPEPSIKNSGGALKLDLRTSRYDVALSYLHAYALQPAFANSITALSPTLYTINIFPQAWQQQVFGFDASLNYKAWSFRFEGSYMLPDEDSSVSFIPNPEFQWTTGIDHSWKNIHVLCEYNVKRVLTYHALAQPSDPALMLEYTLQTYNRLFYRQTHELIHNLFLHVSVDMFHETLKLDIPFTYNVTTKEYLIASQLHLDLADALVLSVGFNKYLGDESTLFDLLKPLYNGYYCKLQLDF